MKIIECQINNFGKIHDAIYEFKDGLNVICEKNGSGKSTLAVFIKTMFYGFANENKRNENENERKKYMPWQGGVYGGQICFEADGRQYLLVRTFGSKDKEDVINLYDKKTMLPVKEFSKNIGEDIFKIDQKSFLKTIFVSQSDCDTEATDSISAKLSDTLDDIADVDNYELGIKKLGDAINALSPDRKTGEIYKLKNNISYLEETIRQEVSLTNELNNCNNNLAVLKGELLQNEEKKELLEEKQRVYLEQAKLSGKAYDYQEICRRYDVVKQRFQAEERFFNDRDVSEEEIEKCYDDVVKLDSLKERLTISDEETIEEGIKRIKRGFTFRQVSLNIIAAISFVVGAFLLFPNRDLAICLLILGIGLFAYTSSFMGKRIDLMRECKQTSKRVNEFLSGFKVEGIDETAKMKQVQDHYTMYVRLKQEYNDIIEEKSNYENDNDLVQGNYRANTYDNISEISGAISECSGRILELNNQINNINTSMARFGESFREIKEAKEMCSAEKEKLEKLLYCYQVYVKTRDMLMYSKENFTAKYINPVNDYFKKYFNYLSGNDDKDYMINANFQVMVKEEGMWRELNRLSSGKRSMIGICMRMAMVDAMYKSEKPFIIFDDPFVYFDNETIELAMELMRNISNEKQVIYFTCHESRVTL